jgi:hypothetical protein
MSHALSITELGQRVKLWRGVACPTRYPHQVTRMRRIPSTLLALTVVLAIPFLPALAQGEDGDWTITRHRRAERVDRDTVQLTLMRSPNGMSSFPVPLSRLRGLSPDALRGAPAAARFQLVSDAGTVTFTGHVGGGTGSGQFDFAAKPGFAELLRRRGIAGALSDHDLFRLTIIGTSAATLDALLATLRKYEDDPPSSSELVRFATHDVTERTVADLGDAGMRRLSPEMIVRLVNHDVDGRYVRDWIDAGYRDLEAEDLIRLRNHDVTPDWARRANERAGTRLGVERLVRLRRGR